jgi:hypothetical protein
MDTVVRATCVLDAVRVLHTALAGEADSGDDTLVRLMYDAHTSSVGRQLMDAELDAFRCFYDHNMTHCPVIHRHCNTSIYMRGTCSPTAVSPYIGISASCYSCDSFVPARCVDQTALV